MERTRNKRFLPEVLFIGFILVFNRLSEYLEPLIMRKIHDEELWLYKNPRTPSFVTSLNNWIICTTIPLVIYWIFYSLKKNVQDFVEGCLGTIFSAAITGLITNIIKNIACRVIQVWTIVPLKALPKRRPRPDFYERCFPDGVYLADMPHSCTGDRSAIIEGLKSFPSGHSSLAFASLGFTSLYLAGKLQCFNTKGRQSWRIVVAFLPLLLAAMIAVSRTADYHHHWQDVLVGSCLGCVVAYVSYRQRYPPLNRTTCHLPYVSISPLSLHQQEDTATQGLVSPTRLHTPDAESVLKIV